MYHTDLTEERAYSDCLYFYHSYMDKSNSWELFPYCVRHDNERLHECFRGQTITFDQLKGKQMKSAHLLEWNTPVEIVDAYLSSQHIADNGFFCNCTNGYFGPRCEYSLDFSIPIEFKEVVYKQLLSRPRLDYSQVNSTNVTCYQGAIARECDQMIMCLDWRQICDGTVDCANGIDERECLTLEATLCDDVVNQYRCLDGRCIARNFLFDKEYDCMDKSDEGSDVYLFEGDCSWEPSVVCEELWYPYFGEIPCGDGEIPAAASCTNNRDAIHYRNTFQYDQHHAKPLTPSCWIYLLCTSGMHDLFGYNCSFCLSLLNMKLNNCQGMYNGNDRRYHFKKFCPSNTYITFPSNSIISSFVYTVFIENIDTSLISQSYWPSPDFICFDFNFCQLNLPDEIRSTTIQVDNLTCFRTYDLLGNRYSQRDPWKVFFRKMRRLFSSCVNRSINQNETQRLFHCAISKNYISPYRIVDRHHNCYFDDNPLVDDTCALNLTDVFKCHDDPTTCLTRHMISFDGCDDGSENLYPGVCEMSDDFGCQFLRGSVLPPVYFVFQEFCNGNLKLQIEIDGETDETNCSEWIPTFRQQNHLCDGVWDSLNGSDELDCPDTIAHTLKIQCDPQEHYCARLNNSGLGCLPVEKANDDIIDCLGASDERAAYCKSKEKEYKCLNSTSCIPVEYLCNGRLDCPVNDDEDLCPWLRDEKHRIPPGFICRNGMKLDLASARCNGIIECPSGEDEWFCDLKRERKMIPFGFYTRLGEFPDNKTLFSKFSTFTASVPTIKPIPVTLSSTITSWYCHRGVTVHYMNSSVRCLCPPSYYGTMCQYQSDRLTVFLRLNTPTSLRRTANSKIDRVPFLLKILAQLIINQKTVSYEQMVDSPQRKHIFYLVFPINMTREEYKIAYVRFDIFHVTRTNIEHMAAWKYDIPFPFLPVNRLSLDLLLLRDQLCQENICGMHGHCRMYRNSNEPYCLCDKSWIGPYCNITTRADYHPDAICLQSTSRQTICVCPLGHFGSRCFASFDPCQVDTCSYHGQCYPTDQRTTQWACLCDTGYNGLKCEFREAELRVKFELTSSISAGIIFFADLRLSQVGLLFIQNRVLLQNIDVQDQIKIINENQIAVSRFVLLSNFGVHINDHELYILVLRRNADVQYLSTRAIESNRCPHVDSLLSNETLAKLAPLAKVKYYARICRPDLATKCFYDDSYLCFCDIVNAPDCLVFVRESTVCNKLPANPCAHNGRCIQISSQTTWDFVCACPQCTYGSLCQLAIEQYTLSFDTLFGREIRPGRSLFEQSPLVKICMSIVICFVIIGFALNALSVITFRQPGARKVGVAIYLFILSLVNQFGLVVLGTKFLFVLYTQMSSSLLTNHRFLLVSCATLEYLLTLLRCLSDWLTACVSIERAVNIIKGAKFNQSMNRHLVKYTCSGLIIIIAASFIHELFNRHIIEDPRSMTIWCVQGVHARWLQQYQSIINIIHLFGPFICNVLSTSFILVIITRSRAKAKKVTMMKMFRQQLLQHQDLIISPIVLILLALPRLILSLVNACTNKPWLNILFIAGYLVSYLPLLGTFIIFVLPSKAYTDVFWEAYRKIRRSCQQ